MENKAKRILDVGNCCRDHEAIRSFLTRHFDCDVAQAQGANDTLQQLSAQPFDLVLVNRKLDRDYSDGVEVIRSIKADPKMADVPVMLVTNYPEHQEAAVAAGALPGFGKLALGDPATVERVAAALAIS
jgi:two-component system chemotaxis response regulator CheY